MVRENGDKYHETSIGWEQRALTDHRVTDLTTHVPLTLGVLVVDSHRMAVELSYGDELLNGFLHMS